VNKHIRLAASLSEFSSLKRAKLGCVIAKNSKILGMGYNQMRHQSFIHTDHRVGTLHAETSAIIDSIKNDNSVKGATVYVVRTMRSGAFAMAKPCNHCTKMLKMLGVKRVIYTNQEGLISSERL